MKAQVVRFIRRYQRARSGAVWPKGVAAVGAFDIALLPSNYAAAGSRILLGLDAHGDRDTPTTSPLGSTVQQLLD